MQLIVNGKPEEMDDRSTVADLVRRFELTPPRVAVEVNEELVPRAQYAAAALSAGDRVEIVTFVGGGRR